MLRPGSPVFQARFSQQGLAMVGFPLLLIPLAIYNIIVFLMPGVSFTDPLVKLTLMSGAEWPLTLSDVLLALGMLLLMCEVIKGARPGAKYLTDHLLSLIVFGAAAAEFVLWPKFGTSTYFLLAALSMVDFLSGLALRTRRSAVAVAAPAVSGRRASKAAAPVHEPTFDPEPAPAPAPVAPATTSVAEPIMPDHPEPQHPVTPHVASPEVPSPGLQPGNGVVPPPPDTPHR
jgi:hypothetical protein